MCVVVQIPERRTKFLIPTTFLLFALTELAVGRQSSETEPQGSQSITNADVKLKSNGQKHQKGQKQGTKVEEDEKPLPATPVAAVPKPDQLRRVSPAETRTILT